VISLLRSVRRRARFASVRLKGLYGLSPYCSQWGGSAGTPILRYYLDLFFREHSRDIRGHCLEFQDNTYSKIGGKSVSRLDIMHLDASNPSATIVADITKANDLPANTFDCIICTHVLCVISDLAEAIRQLHRMLKPGGVLLFGDAHCCMWDTRNPGHRRFIPYGVRWMLAQVFPAEEIQVRSYGNSLVAAAQMRGIPAEAFSTAELLFVDERFVVEVCARAQKAPAVH
jgi:SAM-dependent methyltransferase